MATENLISISSLFEAHLTVSELDRAVAFYRDQLALPLAHIFPERKVAFFWVGAPGKAMLGLWEAGTMPINLSLHVAFQVALPDLHEAPARGLSFCPGPLPCCTVVPAPNGGLAGVSSLPIK